MDARLLAALARPGDDGLVDLDDLRLLRSSFGTRPMEKPRSDGADIDGVDAGHVQDGGQIVDRLLGLDHRDAEDVVVGGLLVGAGRAVDARRGSGRCCGALGADIWQ